ncbi:LPP20 family lipoprotein [Helicobacter cappadocius]|uniref:LPP20 family lipoprotein n=1 Tax=Helicobacter cappadocius TaxID=3063998 RepID=A0AA90Q2R5_9HELI|nr:MULTISPECIES: LPP20 family lipoprotein [unclassified Helicobacter]MDO7252957.1 LPP20 family lipoprotein [Helicobacter sp. faydin-H75]MDP2539053.1 LPP20 family lipoprotein [Helicobacter sp. faydin-H76]
MKKAYFLSILVLIAIFAGCASKGEQLGNVSAYGLEDAPDWVLNSDKELLSATASAKIKNNNVGFATTQATNTARAEIASQIATQIESKYKELTTSNEDDVSQEVVQAIRNSVNTTLSGSKRVKTWISKDGTIWVLVKVDKLDTKLLEENLAKSKSVDKAAAKALSEAVDEIIDGKKSTN